MSETAANPNLFPHPFSRAYWKLAAAEFKKTKVLIFAALMIALRVVLKSLGIPIGIDLKINIAFFINAYGAMVFGPVVAIVAAGISDTLGCILFPTGTYFFPFIFVEIAGSLIFALFFYRARLSTGRVILARFSIDFFVNIVLNTPIMYWYYKVIMGKYYALVDLPRIAKNLAAFPIESLLLVLFLRAVVPATKKLGYVYSDTEKLKFTKKNIAAMLILLVIGISSVCGYSIYKYNTTSLSASYKATERTEKNMELRDVVLGQQPEIGDAENTVAIIESAMQKFGSNNLTYSVAIYSVDEAELAANIEENLTAEEPTEGYGREYLDGYSKSKAKKDDALVYVGYATVVVDKKTGEIVSFEYAPAGENA